MLIKAAFCRTAVLGHKIFGVRQRRAYFARGVMLPVPLVVHAGQPERYGLRLGKGGDRGDPAKLFAQNFQRILRVQQGSGHDAPDPDGSIGSATAAIKIGQPQRMQKFMGDHAGMTDQGVGRKILLQQVVSGYLKTLEHLTAGIACRVRSGKMIFILQLRQEDGEIVQNAL